MSKIHILDDNLIDKIAAGEVVERPSSVVKELLENSVDAGATSVSVEIIGGGIDFIQITDNGKGIPKEQVETAFMRHATSKLNSIDDLEDILTLGFRGEALSSIASVSQVEIVTRTNDEDVGTRLEISAGKIIDKKEVGAVVGTVITIKNLFFNVPARRKFLKKPATEAGYISDIVDRIALGHPEVAFKYINNKSVVIHTAGNSDIKTCAFHIYGRDVALKTIEVSAEKSGYAVSGFVCRPEVSKANRSYENFFINGRFIKSKIVSNAVEDAYRGKLMGGRFPVFALNMTVPANTVDVNVHPTKLEVRFSDEEFIYEFIYDIVYAALKSEILIPSVEIKEKEYKKDNDKEPLLIEEDVKTIDSMESDMSFLEETLKENDFHFPENRQELAEQIKGELLIVEDVSSDSEKNDYLIDEAEFDAKISDGENYKKRDEKNVKDKKENFKDIIDDTYINYGGVVAVGETDNKTNKIVNENLKIEQVCGENKKEAKHFFDNYKIVGQVFKTYWIVEQDDCVYMIDQHAAHERAIYEEFMDRFKNQKILSQRLIQPVAIDLSETQKAIYEENIKLIEEFGFEIEEFGKNTFAVKSVPYIFKNPADVSFFKDILDLLGEKNFDNLYDTKTDAVAAMACKAAVKGNDKLDYTEARALIEKIVSLENPFNCPHGRPTIVKMTKYDVEKFFKRVL